VQKTRNLFAVLIFVSLYQDKEENTEKINYPKNKQNTHNPG